MATFQQALQIKNSIAKKMLNRDDVVGIGVGYLHQDYPNKGASIIIYTKDQNTAISTIKKK